MVGGERSKAVHVGFGGSMACVSETARAFIGLDFFEDGAGFWPKFFAVPHVDGARNDQQLTVGN